jgi:2-polyprenyl-3-methyl-5-hydroxy-6-metoxy-1,4-benzoquinol methylase
LLYTVKNKKIMADTFDLNYQDKTLQQFESHPYPNIPIEESPKNNLKLLYDGSFVTARYRRDKTVITDLENRVMLDIACGTGATTLTMALANPDATIIGVDISPESIKIAEERLKYHGFNNVSFQVLAIEELEQLETKFDYISAGDVLYLLPDQGKALRQMGSVLKPDGIIRSNLHSYYQRFNYYRAQTLFKQMGLMDNNPGEIEMGIVREFFAALKNESNLKLSAWGNDNKQYSSSELLSNHLLLNDKGFTIPQLFEILAQAGLEVFSMVDWWEWKLTALFKDPENLPAFLAMGLDDLELREQLCLYELIQPDKRLLDFWCGHPLLKPTSPPMIEAEEDNWRNVQVHLHPQLKTDDFRREVLGTNRLFPVNLKNYFPFLSQQVWLDRTLLTVLFAPLFEQSRSLSFLVERWLQVRPINPVNLTITSEAEAFMVISQAVMEQEQLGIILLNGAD